MSPSEIEDATEERRASSLESQASTSSNAPPVEGCIRHKVTKFDTLAGLAIKYNVSVADIKRVNGLLSDSALYARGVILVPTVVVSMGEEVQQLYESVISGRNRDPVLHADIQAHPATSAAARVATALKVEVAGQVFPDDVPFSTDLLCQCGVCDISDPDGNCFKRPVELEMSERSSDGWYMAPTSTGPTRGQDMVRRRRAQDNCSDSAEDFGWDLQRRASNAFGKTRLAGPGSENGAHGGGAGSEGRFAQWFSELGKAIGDSVSQTVQKVKDAAQQPALAKPLTSFSTAAEAVLRTGPAGVRKGRGGMVGRSGLPADVLPADIPLPVSKKSGGQKYD